MILCYRPPPLGGSGSAIWGFEARETRGARKAERRTRECIGIGLGIGIGIGIGIARRGAA